MEKLDPSTLLKRLRYQGRQYVSGQIARGGKNQPHMLEQAADLIEKLYDRLDALEKQRPVAWMLDWDIYDPTNSGPEFKTRKPVSSDPWKPLYLAAGASSQSSQAQNLSEEQVASAVVAAARGISPDALDAARYRWLRQQSWDTGGLFVVAGGRNDVKLGTDCPRTDRLDAAIDAARKVLFL